jgi:phytoene dehydrogenase-like protein
VVEGKATPGGGARTEELTLPGFRHDVCSAVHPLGLISPFLRALPLAEHGLEWAQPRTALAHPLDGGQCAVLERSLETTAQRLGVDGGAYTRLLEPFVRQSEALFGDILAPIGVPRHPFLLARFGVHAMQSIRGLLQRRFDTAAAQALLGGCGAHSFLSLDAPIGAAFALVLAVAGHAVGWPVARGGSQSIIDALVGHLGSLGGELRLGQMVTTMGELPKARAYIFDTSPRQLAQIAVARLPDRYREKLVAFRPAPGVFKIDWALSDPIPWQAAEVRHAGTAHVVGTMAELRASEQATLRGEHSKRPFVLLAQPSVCDPSRAPVGRHTGWAYCHVPFGSDVDQTPAIEDQIERFAPGFRQCILARATRTAARYGAYNPNNEGGDIAGGASDFVQLFGRPVWSVNPYATPAPDIFLCSASTPPGGGVHGMGGYLAAKSALGRVFHIQPTLEVMP